MEENGHIKFMRRCIELASKAEGLTYPNPMVGSVIVHEGRIIGEGYHQRSGGPHAEVIAVNSVTDRSLLKESTLYVNLEPCSHFGRTPPCADMIISHSIPRVVAGTMDTSSDVSGRGFKRLRDSGIEVISGICEAECRRLNRRFFTFHEKKRPYITLKWAQSEDGFIDIIRSGGRRKEPTWITGMAERTLVHRWRAEEQAILVGAGTVRKDNPRLNVRNWSGHDPLRLILSSSGIIGKGSAILKGGSSVIIFTHKEDSDIPGMERVVMKEKEPSCTQITDYLWRNGIQSLFIEGGAGVFSHFIDSGIWDEARIFTGKQLFRKGIKAPVINGELLCRVNYSTSTLELFLNDTGQE